VSLLEHARINTKQRNKSCRPVRNGEFLVRSMVSGRYYRSKRAVLQSDRALYNMHVRGEMTNLKTVDPARMQKARDARDRNPGTLALQTYLYRKMYFNNPLYVIRQSEISRGVQANPNHIPFDTTYTDILRALDAAEGKLPPEKVKDTTRPLRRNGAIVIKKVLCERVPVGSEHLLDNSIKNGVEIMDKHDFL